MKTPANHFDRLYLVPEVAAILRAAPWTVRKYIREGRLNAAQHLLDGGADMVDVMHFLGHRNITTTQRVYAPYSRRDMLDRCRGIMEGYTGQPVVNGDLQ